MSARYAVILPFKTDEHPKGSVLFAEGEAAHGVYQLASGRVKLTVASPQGRVVIVRIAGPGDLVGLPGILNGRYAATAEALEPLQARFIPRQRYLRLLQTQPQTSLQAAREVSAICASIYRAMQRLSFPGQARARLAAFLLERLGPAGNGNGSPALDLTHEQVAQMLGLSRETVSRLLGEFKRAGWLEADGASVALANPAQLQRLAAM